LKAADGFVPTSSQPVALCLPATANEVHCSLHELDKVLSDKQARLLIHPGAHKQHLAWGRLFQNMTGARR
jgi:hypothetical protein